MTTTSTATSERTARRQPRNIGRYACSNVDLDRSALERRRLGRILEDAETSRALWMAVIAKAADDLLQMFRLQARKDLSRHERARLQAIHDNHPLEFFLSGRFGAICEILGVPERAVRGHFGIDELLTEVDAA